MVSSDLPTTFLPQLPRQALNTLSPLTEPELTGHIDHLRSLLIQDIYGTSSSPAVSTSSHIGSSSFSSRGSSSGAHKAILEGFERDWAEKWLHGLITRGEGWLAEVEPEDYHDEDDIDDLAFDMEEGHEGSTTRRRASMSSELKSQWAEYSTREKVIKDASALISSLAGCAGTSYKLPSDDAKLMRPLLAYVQSAGGGITRDLSFPLDSSEELVLRVYDAALSDHTSVGVQTWGSAILLGRIFALDPLKYLGISEAIAYRSSTKQENDGDWSEIPRILELGAGTGVMAILCRMLLDRLAQDNKIPGLAGQTIGEVLATDYHPLVLSNLQRCIDLNFKGDRNPESNGIDKTGQDGAPVEPVASTDVDGLRKMLLDWSTFPGIVQQWQEKDREGLRAERTERIPEQKGDWTLPPQVLLSQPSTSSTHADSSTSLAVQMSSVLNKPWDIIIAADCVYDLSHASMIRDVVKWCLRAPELDGDGNLVREGGVLVSILGSQGEL
jgi:predicted nicotinamide N-methyase